MGFSEAASAKALIDKGGNVDRALSHLFDTAATTDDDDADDTAATSDSLLTKKLAAVSSTSTSTASDSWGAVPHSVAPSNFDAYGNPVVYNNHAPVMDSW